MVTFAPGQSRACYNQSVVNDAAPEEMETFNVSIAAGPDIDIGVPGVTQIKIFDDDGREFMLLYIIPRKGQ